MDFFKELMHREQQDKLERFRILNQNVKKGEILFTGSSYRTGIVIDGAVSGQ